MRDIWKFLRRAAAVVLMVVAVKLSTILFAEANRDHPSHRTFSNWAHETFPDALSRSFALGLATVILLAGGVLLFRVGDGD